MTPRHDPVEQLLDVFVYAPLGLAIEAADLLPKLAERGRQRLGGQVTVARMVGELAVRQGQRRAEKLVERMREQQREPRPSRPGPRSTRPTNAPRPGPGPVSDVGAARASAPPGPTPSDATGLAVPGYDTLSASQVVPRLEGLTAGELEAIRTYEQAHRARKTVLTRIDQLLGPAR